jgi:hypothetical protein
VLLDPEPDVILFDVGLDQIVPKLRDTPFDVEMVIDQIPIV